MDLKSYSFNWKKEGKKESPGKYSIASSISAAFKYFEKQLVDQRLMHDRDAKEAQNGEQCK